MVVSVYTIKLYRNAIDKKLLTVYADIAEPNLAASRFDKVVPVPQGQYKRIKIRCFSCPLKRILEFLFHERIIHIVSLWVQLVHYILYGNFHSIANRLSSCIMQDSTDFHSVCMGTFNSRYRRSDLKACIFVFSIKNRSDTEVLNSNVRTVKKHHFPMDTRHSPVVSIFQITTVCPFEDTYSKRILTFLKNICDVELAW